MVLCALALIVLVATSASAAVLGIDYGSEYLKVSIVAPGRTPISIVINEISKRKSTAAVAFTGGDRWLAEEAMNYNARFPERTFTRLRDLLGKDASVKYFQDYVEKYKLSYKVVADKDRGTARIVAENGAEYAVEELVAMILQYAVKIGEGMGKGVIKDAVIAIPPYFGQTDRYALYDAADVAGLNILAEVSDLSCAALQWGIDKEFTPEGKWTIIYDMGATSVGAALVKYSSWEGKDAGKKKQHGQFEVKAVKWDASTGGEDMDLLLIDHFLDEFDAKHPEVSVKARDSPKAIAKLRKQVRKTKEILSANQEAPLSVEGMHEDVDFRSTVTRTTFYELAEKKGLWDRATAPLQAIVDLLPDFNLTLSDVEVVEAIGGATRVPGVKTAVSKTLGGRNLDLHLDADEAVAMGAGLFAANMSTTFRMRKFGAADAAPYAMQVDLHDPTKPEHKPLLPLYKRFPVRRILSVPNATEDVTFTVHHNTSAGPLPPGITADKVADFTITGVPDAVKKYDTVGKINAHFAVDNSGLLYMEKAEYHVEVIDMVEVKEKPKPKPKEKDDKKAKKDKKEKVVIEPVNATAEDAPEDAPPTPPETNDADVEPPAARRLLSTENDAADADADADADAEEGEGADADADAEEGEGADADADAETEVDAPAEEDPPAAEEGAPAAEADDAPKAPPKMRQRKRVFRLPLVVKETGRAVPAMTPEGITHSIEVLKKLNKVDEDKRRQEAAKSNLEAYIYSIREKVAEDEEIAKVTDEAMREKYGAELSEAEDWLYMEGADSTAEEFDAKRSTLQAIGDDWIDRAKELERRPEAVASAKAFVDLARKTVEAFAETKPWLSTEEKDALLAEVTGFEEWLDEKVATQEKKKVTEVPAFAAAEVTVEMKPLVGKLARMKKKAAPKPPPPPPPPPSPPSNETDANATETTEGEAGTAGENATAGEGEEEVKVEPPTEDPEAPSETKHEELKKK
jgi:hypoxia up-regulated 1